jgi:hypothetical protein
MTPNPITAGIVLFIAWRLYSRIRRVIGRQVSRAWRHWTTIVIFPLFLAMFAVTAITHPEAEAALALGVAAGVGLGIWGLRKTKFEATPRGYFYTPNAHIGIALTVLLMARVGYRVYEVMTMTTEQAQTHMQDFGRSPLTLLVFGTLAAYYITYAAGVLRWRASTPLPVTPLEATPHE